MSSSCKFQLGLTQSPCGSPPVVLQQSFLTSDGYLKRVHGSWSGFPQGQDPAHLPDPLGSKRSRMREGNEKGPLLWFTTPRSYRIPSAQGWFLLRRWRYTKADSPTAPCQRWFNISAVLGEKFGWVWMERQKLRGETKLLQQVATTTVIITFWIILY